MSTLIEICIETWHITVIMSTYLLFGFVVAGILHVLIPQGVVEKYLNGSGITQSVRATLIGIPLPLCSCGVIPVSASLKRHGAGDGAVVSFLTATPQTGVDSIVATYGLMGGVFTIFRIVAAMISGIICGIVTSLLGHDTQGDSITATESDDTQFNDSSCDEEEEASCCDSGCSALVEDSSVQPYFVGRLKKVFEYGLVELPQDIGRALLLGLVIAGLMGAFLSDDFFISSGFGTGSSMLLMLVIGTPLYVCSTASIPIAASFINAGISPGAALVFLIVGPATNAATISTIGRLVGKRSLIVYLVTILICALLSGIVMNEIGYQVIQQEVDTTAESPAWYQHLSGIALLLVLANALWNRFREKHEKQFPEPESEETEEVQMNQPTCVNIEGMSCHHCVRAVKEALEERPDVDRADVSLSGTAEVFGNASVTEISGVVEELGYTVTSSKAY